MEKKNQVPKYPPLRFPEFTDEWKKVKLGEVADRINKKNTGGVARVLTISAQYGLVEQEDFFSKKVSSVDLSNYIIVKKGEFAYNKSYSHGYPWGAIKRLDQYAEGVLSPLYICFRLKDDGVDSDYLQQYFEGSQWHKEISLIAMEGARNHGLLNISIQDFFNLPLRLPPLTEQRKIAGLLSLIDERIEVQNAIIKEQEAQKAALLRRLFDRTLRFPEFTDEWKEYQNSEVFEIISEKNTDLRDSNVVSASMNYGVVLRDEIGIDIKYEQESIRGYKVVRDGDYIVHLRSFQGGFAFSRLNGICSPAYTILRPRSNMLEYGFLESYFCSSRFITSLKRVTYGIRDGRSISVEEWMSEKTSLPTLAEQKKIAGLLSAVDERIAVEKEYAALLQKQKAYLLRQMFV